MTTGIERIAAERLRQIEEKEWTPEHDAQHDHGELYSAASYYCAPLPQDVAEKLLYPERWDIFWANREGDKTPTDRDLEKAGALIAAELDRRSRIQIAPRPARV